MAGQFNSRLDDGTDCGLWIVREGLSCGFWAEFAASDEVECGIPDVGEVLRGASGSHPAGVLGEGAVPDAEEAVFDLPVVPGQRQQSSLIHHSGWDRCDGVDHLPRAEGLRFAQALDPNDACGVFPDGIETIRNGAHSDTADFDPAMAMVHMLCAPEIGRVEVSLTLARAAGEP